MLTVHDLHKSYQVGKTTYEVLKGISLEVGKGEFVAVMGPSGSGKTTLLNCISCYIPADSGQITLGGRQLAKLDETALAAVRNKQLGFVFQDFLLLDGLNVHQNILLPAIIGGTAGPAAEQRANQLGFWHFRHSRQIPGRNLRWGKAAHRRGPGPDQQPPAHFGRRAHRQPGFQVQPGGNLRL